MSDIGFDATQHDGDDTATAKWSPSTDVLYSDRIELLQRDPERYFAMYPRPRFKT